MKPSLKIIAVGLVGLFTVLPKPAIAASGAGFNLTTSPLPVSLIAKPGTTITTPIKVENTGTTPTTITVKLDKFSAYGDQGKPAILDPTPTDTYIKWASFSQTKFVAQPGVINTVTMTIKLPKDAAFGYYYAVVFNGSNTSQPGTRQTAVNGAVATLILLNADAPGEKRTLSVTGFTASKKFYEYLPADFTITVHNTGNIHVVPMGNVFITKNHKANLATLDINSGQGNILPNSTRQFSVGWNDGFPAYRQKKVNGQIVSDKTGKPVQQLTWNFGDASKFRIGHYYAQMTLVYNDGSKDVPISGEVGFWVIPWRLLLITAVVALLILFSLFIIGRSIIRRIKKLKQRPPKEPTT